LRARRRRATFRSYGSASRGAQAYKDAVELAVDRWNAHDERYFEAYTQDAPMHGFPATVPPTVEGIRALFGAMWAAFPDIRVEIEHLPVEDDVATLHFWGLLGFLWVGWRAELASLA